MASTHCPECRSANLYQSQPVSAGGNRAPNYLPGLGRWWKAETFTLVICGDCGFTRFFASENARRKLSETEEWTRVV